MTPIRATLAALTAMTASGCVPSAPPVTPAAFDADAPLNPTLGDGRLIYRGYDDHHPTCFAFVEEPTGSAHRGSNVGAETEELECPEGALGILESCPSGKLFAHTGGDGCVCDPIGDEPPTLTPCPE